MLCAGGSSWAGAPSCGDSPRGCLPYLLCRQIQLLNILEGLCTPAFRARGTSISDGEASIGCTSENQVSFRWEEGGRGRCFCHCHCKRPCATPYGSPAVRYSVFRPCVWICDQIAQGRAITSRATTRTTEEVGRRDPQPSPGALHGASGK